MNDEKTNKIISSEELDNVLPKYDPIKLSGKNLAQNYVSAFNTGMNIYQCINYLQGNIDWTINAVNNVVKSWNTEVSESIDQSKAIVRETTTDQFNKEWTNKQPQLIEQVNTLTTNQFNYEKSVFNDELDTLNARVDTLNARVDTFSNPNLLINPDFRINQRGETSYTSAVAQTIKIVYSVDRWCLYGHSLTVNSDKSVTITPTTFSDGSLIQNLETPVDGDITVQVYAVDVSGNATVSVGPSDGSSTTEIGTLKNGLNTFTFSKGMKRLVIRVKSGTLTLKYAKVEKGTVATPFVAPNLSEELVKCLWYYQNYERIPFIPELLDVSNVTSNTASYTPIYNVLIKQMRVKPTVAYYSIVNRSGAKIEGEHSITLDDKRIFSLRLAQSSNFHTVFAYKLTLDAEIY